MRTKLKPFNLYLFGKRFRPVIIQIMTFNYKKDDINR